VESSDFAPLVERCRAGDAIAWEAFVRRIQGRMFALAYSYAGEREDARDLAQEIFVRLYEARSQWPAGDEFLPWLFRVARNRSVDYLRRRSVRRPARTVDEEAMADLPDPAPGAEAEAIDADRRSLLHVALRSLSAISREIVVLRDVHGLPIQQVASILGVPLGTVKSRASRARVELAERVLALARGRGEAGAP
jgi:RNA polymerase sigma-70 factor, ECF subfamily